MTFLAFVSVLFYFIAYFLLLEGLYFFVKAKSPRSELRLSFADLCPATLCLTHKVFQSGLMCGHVTIPV